LAGPFFVEDLGWPQGARFPLWTLRKPLASSHPSLRHLFSSRLDVPGPRAIRKKTDKKDTFSCDLPWRPDI